VRFGVLVVLVLSVLDPLSARINQQSAGHSDDRQVAAGRMTKGTCYHSNHFNFTYRLPHRFIDRTEHLKNQFRALRNYHADTSTFILLYAAERSKENADPKDWILIQIDALSRYKFGPMAKNYTGGTEKDYLHDQITKAYTSAGEDLLQEGTEVSVSGKNFFRAEYIQHTPTSGYRTVMLTFRNGYALSWTFFAQSKAKADLMASSIQHLVIAE